MDRRDFFSASVVTPAPFDRDLFETLRRAAGLRLGAPLTVSSSTASTNDDAFTAAERGAPDGALFVADEQTAGRGRRGHVWTSPPFENLTCSLLLRPRLSAERVSALSLVTGLAVRRAAARRTAEPVHVKWPNDVVVGRRKLAGILVESRLGGSTVQSVVLGVGLNVATWRFPDELRDVATSLSLLGDPEPSREAALADVLAAFEPLLGTFLESGLAPLVPELRAHDALLGAAITVGDVRGIGDGIDDDGALVIRDASGARRRVTSGTVVWG